MTLLPNSSNTLDPPLELMPTVVARNYSVYTTQREVLFITTPFCSIMLFSIK